MGGWYGNKWWGIPAAGGDCDHPLEADVLYGVSYGSGSHTGTLLKYSVDTPSTDNIRQRIITILDTRLKSITVANGYETDAGNNVFQWRADALSESEMPGIIYRDSVGVPAQGAVGVVEHQTNVEVEVFAQGSGAEETLRQLRADVIRCIGADVFFSGLAQDTSLIEDYGRVEQPTPKIMASVLKFSIQYTTERFDPYA